MVNPTFTLEAPGDVNRLPKRYLETPGDVKRLPKRYLECWMSRGRAIPINYYLLLLIITYYCLPFPWAMYWSIMMGNDNTRRDKIDICNLLLLYTIAQTSKKRMNRSEIKTLNTPQEHVAEKLQHWYTELAKREINWDKNNILRIHRNTRGC